MIIKKTRQEAFDLVWKHFVVGKGTKSFKTAKTEFNGVSLNPYFCLYGKPGGPRCAFGVLLGDEPLDEIGSAYDLSRGEFEKSGLDPEKDRDFAQGIQGAHDRSSYDADAFHASIEWNLRVFAQTWGLVAPPEVPLAEAQG